MAFTDADITTEETALNAYLAGGAQQRVRIGDLEYTKESAEARLKVLREMRAQRLADDIEGGTRWPLKYFVGRVGRS